MTLRAKPEIERQLGQRGFSASQQGKRQANPPLIHEAIEAQAGRLPEFSGKVAGRQAKASAHDIQRRMSGEVGVYALDDLAHDTRAENARVMCGEVAWIEAQVTGSRPKKPVWS
jgi:hypothetical protein